MRRLGIVVAMLFTAAAEAAKPAVLELTIVGEGGAPVPDAIVTFAAEGTKHCTAAVPGTWSSDRLTPAGADAIVFARGVQVDFEVDAPGYVASKVVYMFKGGTNRLVLELQPAAEEPKDDPAWPCKRAS